MWPLCRYLSNLWCVLRGIRPEVTLESVYCEIPIQIPRADSTLRRAAIQGRPSRYQYQVRLQQEKGRTRFSAYSVPEYLIMHYYQFNIGDYSSHTKGLSPIEDLAYRRLIDEYYLSEQPFNGCSADVARLIGLREFQPEVDYVLNRYFVNQDDKWVHGRIEKEIFEYKEKQEKRSNAGKKSAEARQKQADDQQTFNTCSTSDELTNNHKPITKNQEPVKKDKPTGKPLVNFSRWLEIVKEQNEKPIPEDSPIFEYAKDAGIDPDYLRLAWVEFKARYTDDNKRYKDWRAVFSKAVRGNWFKLWWHDGSGYQLTTLGQQNMTAMKNRDKREQQ